ncbi:ATP synthase subunit G atp20 [Vermiconidia calcicola]|uniref:ATP synthase subunit G atp20 n=1 Tax=Vermiconidia calcicola TaxID=1690605 RepID=A0ACC3N6J9_9PEZI|nr:ATP synthase subunit G atp20 [Vermiconidia calcicola]
MSTAFLPRLVLRQSRLVLQRRAASSTTESAANAASSTANKAKEGASQATSQAQQGLSRVTSSAGSALSGVTDATTNVVSRVGGRTGAAINFVQGIIPPTLYYARVGGELAKMIYRGRNMQPPTMQTIQSYLTPLQNAVRNPSSITSRTVGAAENTAETAINNPQRFMESVRNMDSTALLTAGVVAAEAVGFFCVGEMIGRLKIVGYRAEQQEHH